MNKEDFVSYETAVKLKELGFDWECHEFWDTSFCVDGTPTKIRYVYGDHKFNVCVVSERNSMLEQMGSEYITAPTMAKAQKWLREIKGIAINVVAHDGGKYNWEDVYLPNATEFVGYIHPDIKQYETYEAALSAGIEAALKLIEEGEV